MREKSEKFRLVCSNFTLRFEFVGFVFVFNRSVIHPSSVHPLVPELDADSSLYLMFAFVGLQTGQSALCDVTICTGTSPY